VLTRMWFVERYSRVVLPGPSATARSTTMVEREQRRPLADLLEALVSGTMTIDEYASRQVVIPDAERPPRKERDRGLIAVCDLAWSMCENPSDGRLVGKMASTSEGLTELRRWILFLRSDLEYEWRTDRFSGTGGCLLNLLTLGWWARRVGKKMTSMGGFQVWPFIRDSDYRQALAQQASQRG